MPCVEREQHTIQVTKEKHMDEKYIKLTIGKQKNIFFVVQEQQQG